MKNRLFALLALTFLSTLNPQLSTLFAQSTSFTYQGRLNSGTTAATGSYDMTFTLFASASGGSSIPGPATNTGVPVSNGLFTVIVPVAAGAGAFPGSDRWLEIGVRTNGSGAF